MIVGKGLIGEAFESSGIDFSDYIIFASGVSNSEDTDDKNYKREEDLIIKTIKENRGLKIIYFSCVLAGVTNNKYYNSKLKIEEIIKRNSSNYIIFRVPQIIGKKGNPNNLLNYLKNSIINEKEISIYNNIERSLVDVDDLIKIVNYCKDKVNCETLNFSSINKINVFTLCNLISKFISKIPVIKIVENHDFNNWEIKNSDLITEAIINSNINVSEYNDNILKKYLN